MKPSIPSVDEANSRLCFSIIQQFDVRIIFKPELHPCGVTLYISTLYSLSNTPYPWLDSSQATMTKPNPYKTTQMDNSILNITGYHVVSLDFADGVVENVGYVGAGPKQL